METIITSVHNSKIKTLKKMLKNPTRDSFIIFDKKAIKIANSKRNIKEIYSIKPMNYDCPNYLVNKSILNTLKENIDALAVASLKGNENKYLERIVYLDAISDPSNLGKIIYLMHKYHYTDLVLSPNTVSIFNQKCLQYCSNYIFDINIHYKDAYILKELKKEGYQIISTGLKSSTLLDNFKASKKHVLILGNEAHGVNEYILSLSDVVIRIDIKNIDSFNVSIAASIMMDNL